MIRIRTSSRVHTRRLHRRPLIPLLLLCAAAPAAHINPPTPRRNSSSPPHPSPPPTHQPSSNCRTAISSPHGSEEQPRARPDTRHLGLAPHSKSMVPPLSARSRAQHRLLEPGPLPLRRRQTLAVLQIRSQRPHLDRRPPHQHRRSPLLVAARPSPRRPSRPH